MIPSEIIGLLDLLLNFHKGDFLKHKTVFVPGIFNVLHPGHFRLLKHARSIAETVIIGLLDAPSIDSEIYPVGERLKILREIGLADEIVIIVGDIRRHVFSEQPCCVLVGTEELQHLNGIADAVLSYGGKLVTSSGDFLSEGQRYTKASPPIIYHDFDYINRLDLNLNQLATKMDGLRKAEVCVLGEVILDEYVTGQAVGLSQEDPTIVMRPDQTTQYMGGAAIVAGHALGLGANSVGLVTVIGDDENGRVLSNLVAESGLDSTNIYTESSRITITKRRYRVQNKTLLRVNMFRNVDLDQDSKDRVREAIQQRLKTMNVLVISDFGYGMLDSDFIGELIGLAKQNNVFVAADSQTSSQHGDLAKMRGVDFVCPTELEARRALNDFKSGLVTICQNLSALLGCEQLVITLGSEGALLFDRSSGVGYTTEVVSALNNNPVDVSGAGDSFLISASMAMTSGLEFREAIYLASTVAAVQVGTLGNKPVQARIVNSFLRS